jgi:SdpI/YfhL protein family
MRKWLPAALIAAAFVSSAMLQSRFPSHVPLDLRELLPSAWTGSTADDAPRAVALFALPALALLLWALLHEAPVSALGRAAGRVFFNAGEPRYDVFAPTYRLSVLWVVALVLSLHVALLSTLLHWSLAPGLIVGLTLGLGLALVGNAMPRLRQNAVAGIRTARTMSDPAAWARVHRTFGAVWLVAGLITIAVAIVAPRYAVLTGIALLALSSLAGLLPSAGMSPRRAS